MIYKVVFSPTGGTARAAHYVAESWGDEVKNIDLASPAFSGFKFAPGDLVMLAVPSYGGRVPEFALNRIRSLEGHGAQCVLLCTFGNRAYDDTLVELEDAAKEAGFVVRAAVAAATEHSIVRKFGHGRPDEEDREELEDFGRRILKSVENEEPHEISVPGRRPYHPAPTLQFVPTGTKACGACGTCSYACPAQAIPRSAVKTTDKEKCISCMRCVTSCPQKARRLNRMTLGLVSGVLSAQATGRKDNELYL